MADIKITVRPNGPYRVEAPIGAVDLVDADGNPFDLSAKLKDGRLAFSLCRCGGSITKPFCDGAHSRIGFQGAESAVRTSEENKA
jgi:CDGSH-type Zn-finger protein